MRHFLPLLLVAFTISCFAQKGGSASVDVAVDASEAPRNILHVVAKLPAEGSSATYDYAEWIPGEHGPTGPVTDLVGLHFFVNGKDVPWSRDSVDMYKFHVQLPDGTTSVEAHYDQILPVATGGFSSGASSTANLLMLSWNQVTLYPDGLQSENIAVTAHLKLPEGWKSATALPRAGGSGSDLNFAPSTLTTLVDSPVLSGIHFRTIDLGEDLGRHHYFDIASDSEAALQLSPEVIKGFKQMVRETGALFGARHYREYHFLVTLSDNTAHFGLEHHESSDDRSPERSLVDEPRIWRNVSLYSHEMTHSWNGKYRRPAGLATGNYQDPMKGDLLWVYEGLTQYIGEILPARSGFWNTEEFMQFAADVAASLDHRAGRTWRPLQDTATAAQLLYGSSSHWQNWRRSVDYYDEGFLLWLEADVIIRTQSHGQKSLDDFCKRFHGAPSSDPKVVPYAFDDIVSNLNAVQPYDWRGFWTSRLQSKSAHAPLGGFENGGWKLTYTDKKPKLISDSEETGHVADFRYSLGLWLDDKGEVIDILMGLPADKSGIAPGMKLIAVNGRAYSHKVLSDALKAAKTDKAPIELILSNNDFFKTYSIDYHEGEKFPLMVRDPSKPDIVSQIISSKAGSVPARKPREKDSE